MIASCAQAAVQVAGAGERVGGAGVAVVAVGGAVGAVADLARIDDAVTAGGRAVGASLEWLQPAGQQLSPAIQALIGVCEQAAVQAAAEPARVSAVQALPSSQLAGQGLAGSLGSQVSPGSNFPLPQVLVVLPVQPMVNARSTTEPNLNDI